MTDFERAHANEIEETINDFCCAEYEYDELDYDEDVWGEDEEEDDFYDEDCFPPYLRTDEMKPLVDLIKRCVRAEYRNKVEVLEDENKKLSEFKESYDTYQSELKELERKFNDNMETLRNKSFRRFVKDFFEDRYIITWNYEYDVFDKCKRCDEHRRIEFTSPSGKILSENCMCHRAVVQYRPSLIRTYNVESNSVYGTVRIFTQYDKEGDRVELTDFTYYDGESYEELLKTERRLGTSYNGSETPKYRHIIFRTEEECQNFCNYLNAIKYNEECVKYCKELCNADGIEFTDEVFENFMRGTYR